MASSVPLFHFLDGDQKIDSKESIGDLAESRYGKIKRSIDFSSKMNLVMDVTFGDYPGTVHLFNYFIDDVEHLVYLEGADTFDKIDRRWRMKQIRTTDRKELSVGIWHPFSYLAFLDAKLIEPPHSHHGTYYDNFEKGEKGMPVHEEHLCLGESYLTLADKLVKADKYPLRIIISIDVQGEDRPSVIYKIPMRLLNDGANPIEICERSIEPGEVIILPTPLTPQPEPFESKGDYDMLIALIPEYGLYEKIFIERQ